MLLDFKHWFTRRDYAWRFKLRVCLPVLLGLIFLDWLTKGVVMATMKQGQTISLIPNFIRINYVINLGAAYGTNASKPALAIALAALVTIILILVFLLMNEKKYLVALSFLLSGSLANLLGRSWAPPTPLGIKGGVIDFLQWEFSLFNSDVYIFNIADVLVIIGVCLLIIVTILDVIKHIKLTKIEDSEQPTTSDQPANPMSEKKDIEKTKKDK